MRDIAQGSSLIDFTEYDYIYVDKTEQIYSLLKTRRVFFSRPRRFGKSLVLDTIATLFEHGVEPYFKNTWIYDKWNDKSFPVLKLNFLEFSVTNYDEFCDGFCRTIQKFARRNHIEFEPSDKPIIAIGNLFESLDIANQKIVILIDEYDCQMTANINNPKLYQKFLEMLRDLCGYLKGKQQIRFLAITGVTRLRDTTIFSVGSDIKDVSKNHYCSTLVGYTKDEIRKYYSDYLTLAASYAHNCHVDEVKETQKESMLEKLAELYDGYCFDEDYKNKVFSTWSINNFFFDLSLEKQVKFGDYWYDNGGIPSILANYLKTHVSDFSIFLNDGILVDLNEFNNPSSLLTINQNVLMYQTGYLTLRSNTHGPFVKLATPNMEVKNSLLKLMAYEILDKNLFIATDYRAFFSEENADNIVAEINRLLNTISYERYPVVNESIFRVCLQSFFTCVSDSVYAEMHNSKGRADLTVEIGNRRIVFELKYAANEKECSQKLEEAIAQITERDYGNVMPKKNLLRIAMVFNGSKDARAITHFKEV